MELDKNSCDKTSKTSPITFRNIDFISCLFYSDKQYNQDKIHIPKYSLCIERLVSGSSLSSIENGIDGIIDEIYNKLNENNTFGRPIKIPAPIYILLARELEYHSSILEAERFVHFPLGMSSKLGKATITPEGNGTLAILDYLNSFFNSSDMATDEDKKKYEKSHLNNYKFKGRVKIILYVPYLTNNYTYITNFKDMISSSTFIYNLIISDVFLKFERTSNIDKLFIQILKKARFSKDFITTIINILKESTKTKFLLYDDLINLCFEGGCVSSVGEDLKVLIPAYDKDEATNAENAVKYSPFLPNKCLSKTNNFLCNVKYAKDYNKGMDEFVKKYAMADIINGLGEYSLINDMVNKNMISQDDISKIDKYKSPLNLIISIINTHIKNGFSDDLNKEDREITVKENTEDCTSADKKIKVSYNHYSKEYSENIIKELSLLNYNYPGIPEMVMSLYIYKSNLNSEKIVNMPWGNKIISPYYFYHIFTPIEINTDIYSLNNKYALRINKKGLIYVYNIDTNRIHYFINDIQIENIAISMIYDKTTFTIQIIDQKGNQRGEFMKKRIPKLIDNCNECKDPISMIIDDNGMLKFYGNSFYEVTSKEFTNFIGNQIESARRNSFNMDELELGEGDGDYNQDMLNRLDDIQKISERYQYCSENQGSCSK